MIQSAEHMEAIRTGAGPRRLHNFSAGPAVLPEEVLLEVRDELPAYKDAGSSVLEISHRSSAYDAIDGSAKALLRKLLGLTDDWHILFLQGGASLQFYQVPLNFLPRGGSADYLDTGTWASKALKEARTLGNARVAGSSKADNYTYIPDPSTWDLDPGAAYLHFTSNNTIYGTRFEKEPEAPAGVPLVCDASSDFLSRPIDVERYGLIYAGAQKNLGPAGVTLVLVRDELLSRRNEGVPTMLDYGTHTDDLYNTPPVFAVYVVEKVLRWLDRLGGLEAMEERNEDKARLLYDRIDAGSLFYRGYARADSRSRMNVTFNLATPELEKRFVDEAKREGLLQLKGHRSVGGIRASIYNACPRESVEALVSFMDAFEGKNG